MKRLASPLVTILFALAPCSAQVDGAAAPHRKQPTEKSTQDKVNDVFGELLSYVTYLPFANIASWFGLDTDPQYLRDERGEPRATFRELKGHGGAVQFGVFAPDGASVLTTAADDTAYLFDLRGKQLTVQPHPAAIRDAKFFPGGGEFATACADGKVRVFGAKEKDGTTTWSEVLTIDAHQGEATNLWYSTDGVWLASYGTDGSIRLWDSKGRKGSEFAEMVGGVRGVMITKDREQDNELVYVLDGERTLRIYQANGTAVSKVEGQAIQSIEIGADETHVLITLADQMYTVMQIDGLVLGTVRTPKDIEIETATLTFEKGEVRVVLLDKDKTRHWFNDVGDELRTEKKSATVADGFFTMKDERSPNSISLHTHHDDTVWVLGGHQGRILDSAMSPNGTRVVTVSIDGTARIWDWYVRGPDDSPVATNIPFVVLWLVIAAVFFTIYMKFVNFRMFRHAIQVVRGKFSNPDDEGEVTHFQALSSALSATVGLGNIAGVAIAVSVGGPGATFWMIIAGLLGMTLKFTECTLGQKFRKIDKDGRVSGGPMHYLKEGLQQKNLGFLGVPLAIIFTVFCIGGSLAGGNAFQVNQSGNILKGQVPFFAEHPYVYGLIMALFVGIVIIGGIRRIAQTAEKIVPTMCSLYVLAAMTILVMNIEHVPGAFGTIVESALSGDAIYGGALGSLIMGFRRAAFSNEAGVGSASIAHSAARTPYAVREGIVALLEPFIDTVVVCTMTALVIVITGVYDANQFPEFTGLVAGNNGAALTAKAFSLNPILAGWFPWVLMAAVILFAFSTMISWSYYGERCWTNLFGPKSSLLFKILFLAFTVLGSVVTATNVLEFGDVMILLMAFPNILGLYFLGGLVKSDLSDYEARMDDFEVYK